jgi:hypothetical protein
MVRYLTTLIVLLLPLFAWAANTHTVDLEGSSSQYLTGGNISDIEGVSALSVEFWVNVETPPANGLRTIAVWDGSANSAWRVLWEANQWYFQTYDGATGTCDTSSITTTGSWYHMAFTWDGSQALGSRCKIYKDGTDVTNSDTTKTSVKDNTLTFSIGNEINLTANGYYDGFMDDVRIWNYKRSEAEIDADYNCQLAGTETGLLHNWILNNGYTDSVSGGPTLTAFNSPVFQTGSLPYTDNCGGGAVIATSTSIVGYNTTLTGTSAAIVGH